MFKKIFMVISFGLLVHQSYGQELKLSAGFGGGSSNSEYIYNSFIGPYAIQGQYVYSADISYPVIGKGFGLFLETNNKHADIVGISFKSNNLVSGLCWRKSFKNAEIEFLSGFGYSWDKYELTDSRLGYYSISNKMSLIHTGITFYLPLFDLIDVMIGARLIKNNSSHVSASFNIIERNLLIPSTLYVGMVGLNFNLFGTKQI